MRFRLRSESAPFKSIPPGFDSGNLGDFVVLTGPNGSGKTQFLELLAEYFRRPNFENTHRAVKPDCDFTCHADECVLVPWNVKLGDAHQVNPSFLAEVAEKLRSGSHSGDTEVSRVQEAMAMDAATLRSKTLEEIVNILPIEAVLSTLEYSTSTVQLARLALKHMTSIANRAKRDDLKWSDAEKLINGEHPDPVAQVNEQLATAGMNFRIRPPSNFDSTYTMFAEVGDKLIRPSQLSSGEQTILGTILIALFATRDRPPRLILLDETDAHLHPSQIRGFLRLLEFLSRSVAKVLLVTHRIDTVSLAADTMLYLKTSHSLERCTRAEATGAIAGFMVEAMKSARLVYVEDRADQDFYRAADRLRSPAAGGQPDLIFQPIVAGISGAKNTSGGGGCQAIIDRIADLRTGSMAALVRGLIDRDVGNPAQPDVFVLCRYAIENFLFDPLILYMESVKAGNPIEVPDSTNNGAAMRAALTGSDLVRVACLPSDHLQDIATAVTSRLERHVSAVRLSEVNNGKIRPPMDSSPTTVAYNGGTVRINVPAWLLTARGKDFYPAAEQAFGRRPKKDDLAFLFEAMGLLPDDLNDFMATVK